MIVLRSTYTADADAVGALRDAHLTWLSGLLEDGTVIAAGRLDPPTGAVILGAGLDADALLRTFDEDPYVSGGVARYEEVVRFEASAASDAIKALDRGAA